MTDVHLDPTRDAKIGFAWHRRLTGFCVSNCARTLRFMTLIMMLVVASIPVALFYKWVERSSYIHELQRVDENHLIIARNLSSALSRYTSDALALFSFVVADSLQHTDLAGFPELLKQYDLCHVTLLDADDTLVSQVEGHNKHNQGMPAPEIIAKLRGLASASPGKPVISDIISHDGKPHFFIAEVFDNGQMAFAPWSPRYVMALQKSISFGELGHSMIVDQTGKVVAHPNAEWQRTNKDASKLPVVQAMLAGKTGVMQFYSPPLKADMIAGYTFVPETGWGVMVPQPVRELELRAEEVQRTALYISCIVVGLAALMAIWFSRLLTAPILSVVTSARRISEGDYATRVGELPRYTPREIGKLARAFDTMASDIDKKTNQLTESLKHEKELSEERAALLVEAQHANAVKSQFVATISHELRTPLTSIRGSLELLKQGVAGPVPEKASKMCAIALKNAGRLQGLIDDLLDLEKLDSGKMIFRQDKVDLRQTVTDAVEANDSYGQLHEVRFNWIPTDQPAFVIGDSNRLMQVMANLLSNAAKFSGSGDVVDIALDTSESGTVRVTVTDHGIGIAQKNHDKLFEKFVQIEADDTRRYGGTGLGLAITRMIVESHGGSVGFSSAPNEGSAFWFELPLATDGPARG
ncbi:sensor histidine kinase [Mesobacterium sp. TK19101]|uniref:histidine kinase n=1 Tax=Mesobacterium hydrothermale TaxID=3111907 RepID=A0ABU6HL18_9RHOB|nr:sensor histidine kinase [Mesobacterium sp. TK19101]MEC3863159.1 sensor histidine kinase [Mesobacterium sp. TK19101]